MSKGNVINNSYDCNGCLLTGKLGMDDGSDEEGSQQSGGGPLHRSFKSQLDKALTARQEAEARVATLEEKIQQYETGKVELKLKVIFTFVRL